MSITPRQHTFLLAVAGNDGERFPQHHQPGVMSACQDRGWVSSDDWHENLRWRHWTLTTAGAAALESVGA